MARFARVVLPGQPYHVTHRGNRRGEVFFSERDRRAYLDLLAAYARQYGLDVWGWCLMGNHVYLLVVPRRPDSMALAIGRNFGDNHLISSLPTRHHTQKKSHPS